MPTKNTKNKKRKEWIDQEYLDVIGEIPVYYGFNPQKSPEIKKSDIDKAKSLLEGDYIGDESSDAGKNEKLPLHVEEKISLLRMYEEKEMHTLPQPVMMYFKDPFKCPTTLKDVVAKTAKMDKKAISLFNRYADLEVMGQSGPIAEATLIQTARMMLLEEGYKNICIEINSIGDRDSMARHNRDLTNFYKKHINDMHAECRQLLKKDPFELLACTNEKCRAMNENAPKSINFLSEPSRVHFRELLEYVEALGIQYRINTNLLGNRKYCSETVFAIVDEDYDAKKPASHRILGVGMRYDGLAKRVGCKKDIPGVGLSLLISGNVDKLRKPLKKTRNPWASFVQLGFESKLVSLPVIEALRAVDIPLSLALAKDRLGAQVSLVDSEKPPYSIIIGKKEAVERSAIVRHGDTRAQETVSLDDLPKYMKKLEKQI